MTTKSPAALVLLFIMSARCLASGYEGDLADAWGQASIVVLGHPQVVPTSDKGTLDPERGTYRMDILRAYKGAKAHDRIEFVDPFFRSTAELYIQKEMNYVVFLQTKDDRKKHPPPATERLGEVLTGLHVLMVNDVPLAEVEAAITTVTAYETLAAQDRKAFLLRNLVVTNAYSHRFIEREILLAGITEALPYFQQKLSQATNDADRLDLISKLRCLGDPSVKAVLLAWLADDSFKRKVQVIEEMVRLKDASVLPTIRNFIHAEDDLLAVEARSALFRLGDPDGKRLLLEAVQRDIVPTARYNAIHYLNWGYSGEFTDTEKAMIRDLVNDKDTSIARVAGFIVEKWKPRSNNPSDTTSQ